MNHSQANLRDQSEQPTGVLRSQWRAMLCLVASWILGTCIFETLSWGKTPSPSHRTMNIQSSLCGIQNISQQWRELETEISLAESGYDNFSRVDHNHRIRPSLMQMIRTEQAIVALRESTKSFRRAPANVKIDPDAVVVDPIIDSMHIAKADVTEAYRKLDESSEHLLLTQRSCNRLAWDVAQMSALPGLIRLVAVDVDERMSPVHVKRVIIDQSRGQVSDNDADHAHPTRCGADLSISKVIPAASSDLNVNQNEEHVSATRILRARPKILTAVQMDVFSPPLSAAREIGRRQREAESPARSEIVSDPTAPVQQTIQASIVEPTRQAVVVRPTATVQKCQVNILVSPEVAGTIPENVDELTVEVTLRGVLKMSDLKSGEEDGLTLIYSFEELHDTDGQKRHSSVNGVHEAIPR